MAAKSFQFFCYNPRPGHGVAELETARDKPFELCLQLHQVVVEVSRMGAGVPDLLDDSCGSLSDFWDKFCTTERSTSISVAFKATKKFLLDSSPWNRILGSHNAGASVVGFFIITSSYLMESA
jgi:hypothetical protein